MSKYPPSKAREMREKSEQLRDEILHSPTLSYPAVLEAELREAWKIIDILYMDALDNNGEAWPRAREWQERNRQFSPQNDSDKPIKADQSKQNDSKSLRSSRLLAENLHGWHPAIDDIIIFFNNLSPEDRRRKTLPPILQQMNNALWRTTSIISSDNVK